MNDAAPANPPSFSLGRKFGVGVGVFIACLSVAAIVVMANYLAARHFLRVDCSRNQGASLSPKTLQVLEVLTNEIQVVVYFDPSEMTYKPAVNLHREYAAKNPRLRIQLVNPLNNPAEAQAIKLKYKLSALNEKNLILFDCNGRTKSVYQSALAETEYQQTPNDAEGAYRKRLRAFRGEIEFTSALVSVTDPRQLRAYFVQGHGEHDPTSRDEQIGYAKFTALLMENNLQPDTVSLLGTSEIPADCSLLIVAGAAEAFTKDELDKIERYLNQGGRLLAMFSCRSLHRRTGLESLLTGWGVVVGERYVLDPLLSTPNAQGQDLIEAITPEDAHAITRPLVRSSIHLLLPRSISTIKSASRGADNLRADELLHTSPQGVLVSSFRAGLPDLNPARDPRGAFSLMAAVEKGSVPGVSAGRGSTRIVITGDSLFLANQMIESAANRDFAAHAVNWLVDRTYLLAGIGPKPLAEFKLELTNAQMSALRWIMLGGMPGGVLFLGLLVWLRRRR